MVNMIPKTVEVYRLWPDKHWDTHEVTIEIPEQLFENEEFIESQAVQKAWIQLIDAQVKPLQIGLYMLSIYGA